MNYFEKFKTFLKEKFGISIAEFHNISWGIILGILAGTPTALAMFTIIVTRDGSQGHIGDLKNDFIYFWFFFMVTELAEFLITGQNRTILNLNTFFC